MTLDGIDITDNLVWVDEFQFNQIEQSQERSLTGGLIVQEGVKRYGRPITLRGWLPRATLDLLFALEATPATAMTLVLADARTFSVIFNRTRIAIEADEVAPYTKASTEPDWQYQTTLNLLTVEPSA
ncbi:hypothetical protein HCU74_08420 [Spongiibacter sp. KMU-166]|uniref:Phage tail protein n=1 Tax=Spongiibacter thalassae TaxID=2721624 RepID=A0ABX1GE24_9GAMM|nr:hypothetical protein [Spongiibacter thalassae]NKI17440.1 hypothetical protein [Spongiibacter thalassae]